MNLDVIKFSVALIFLLIGPTSLAMTNTSVISPVSVTERQDSFWQQGIFSSFIGVDKKRINYAQFTLHPAGDCLVVAPGRAESYIKYQELAFELSQQGYNIFIIDHRGQGLSQRMIKNKHKGYVTTFDDYAQDLATFIKLQVMPYCANDSKPLLLAHSMGGAIAVRTIQLYPELIKAAVLSSPMFAINSGGLPMWLAKGIISSGVFINELVAQQPWYFIGQGNYQAKAFIDNPLTHSKTRYQRFINDYQQQPKAQLGGVTYQWLAQAIKVNKDIFSQLEKIKTPLLILQAGGDSIVDNQAQNNFCIALAQRDKSLCSAGKPLLIADAYHELFFEQNQYRQPALEATLNWLNKYRVKTK